MLKILAAAVTVLVIGLKGNAMADSYYEEYYGVHGYQFISQYTQDFSFHFDFTSNPNTHTTNSNLSLIKDASGFHNGSEQLDYANLYVELWSTDYAWEAAKFSFDIGGGQSGDFSDTVFFNASRQMGTYYSYEYSFTPEQILALEETGWGTLTISAFDIENYCPVNDIAIKSVALEGGPATQPVPEPATFMLFGGGLAGLISLSRRAKRR